MTNFVSLIKRLDPGHVLDSIKALPLQCEQAWGEAKKIRIPVNYKNIENIIVCGMGGSNIGTDFLRNVFYKDMKVPVVIVADYHLPDYASNKSLVIISGYSGNTEEPLFCIPEAIKKKCKLLAITTGGQLEKIAKSKKIPTYFFEPRFNPSSQPRMGLGYSIMAKLAFLKNLNLLNIKEKEVLRAIDSLNKNKQVEGKAKKLAEQLYGKIPIIMAAEVLSGNAHILANQINESAKSFAAYFILPELNHHLMEGLSYPKNNKNLTFLFLESQSLSPRIIKRIKVTKKLLEKNDFSHFSYNTSNKGKLSEALEVLAFGSYLSFYLAMLYGINPGPIPNVDYFKNELAKER